jgi:exosortase/archaeosortase family protein
MIRDWLARRIASISIKLWLALLLAAVWPPLHWMATRLLWDGSDEPLGLVALLALVGLGVWQRRGWRRTPGTSWLALMLALVLGASIGWGTLPPLVCALWVMLAFAAGLLAVLPGSVAAVPVLGLALLSLPLMASLQFYAGYPLRLLVAEMSRWLLCGFFQIEREGVVLRVEGQQVLVDAACSGVQLVWMGYFTACAVALMVGRGNASFLSRLPAVGLIILAGNVLRNTLLVATQADGVSVPEWAHQGIGLLVLAAVCATIATLMLVRLKPRAGGLPVGEPRLQGV